MNVCECESAVARGVCISKCMSARAPARACVSAFEIVFKMRSEGVFMSKLALLCWGHAVCKNILYMICSAF